MPATTARDPQTLYQRVILKHARAPVGLDREIRTTHRAAADNPLCGDDVRIELEVDGEVIRDAAYGGEFCAVCSASASLMCGHLPGMPVATFDSFSKALLDRLDGRPRTDELPGDLEALLEVRQFPVRVKCAALPWQAARAAMRSDA